MEHMLGRFGDRRLEKEGVPSRPSFFRPAKTEFGSPPPLGCDRAGEVRLGRFRHNPRVTPSEMVATAHARTAGLVKRRHVLAIQDIGGC
jgi:hypothetical protein